MISFLLGLATWKARLALFAAIGLGVISLRAWDIHHQRAIGAERIVAKMEKASNANAKKADAARNSVDKLPDERLRDKYFRD